MPTTVPIQAAERTLKIVEILSRSDGLTISELASTLDIPKSTVYDYLQTLVELEYIVHHDDGYRLGTKLLGVGARRRLQYELFKTAKPELKRLADETGEHATLMIEEHGMGILLHTVMGSNAVEVVAHDGTRTYLHTTAPGKAILANLSPELTEQILKSYGDNGLPGYASQTITSKSDLLEELEITRERGYALDENEAIDGMRGLGVPIIRRDNDSVAGAVSIYAPLNRSTSDEFEEEIPELLLQAANVIELNLSYGP